ncbi:lipase family protein [Nocardia colli]|uniref:lipase family protein n=1 Tax=Nocardia colli TaxID=2545717 RepID=UPI0035D97D3D
MDRNPAQTGSPGELLRVEPMTARILGVPLTAGAWRVHYRSTTATGEPTVVSGVILIPESGGAGRPLLGFAPGTQGLARSAAALSRQLAWGVEYEATFLAAALARGWVVAVTDYPGLGTPGVHPYVVGRTNGRAVLDIMRAARRLSAARLDDAGPVGIYGYSEGGSSAGWAAQLQPTYAPDLRLDAVAVGSVPSDLLELVNRHDGGLFGFLLLYAAIGFDSAYPELQLDRYLNPLGRRVAALCRRTHIVGAIAAGLVLPKQRSRYLVEDPLTQPDWIARLRENDLGDIAPAAPVLVGHGRQDQIMPYHQSHALVRSWRGLGADVQHYPIRFGEHLTAAPQFARIGFAFLADHFERHRAAIAEPFSA